MSFKNYLDHNMYKSMLPRKIDLITEEILEMFNSNLEIKNINGFYDFSTEWNIDNDVYRFLAKKYPNDGWVIRFERNYDTSFSKANNKRYVGDIFTGVFKSLERLIKIHNVNKLTFSTDENNTWLVKFYSGKHFKRYLEKQFKYEYVDSIKRSGMIVWTYDRKW